MKKYIFGRVIRSIISILAVVSLAIVLVYSLMPRKKVFENDPTFSKVKGDEKTTYMYQKWEDLGYLDFQEQSDLCLFSSDYNACMSEGKELEEILDKYAADGYNTEYLKSGLVYAYKDHSPLKIFTNFITSLVNVDNPFKVQDEANPNLERGYYIEAGANGIPAIKCSGCEYQYQLYINGSFPFIHQNIFKLNFGKSYPTYSGQDALEVITSGQGAAKTEEITFPTGVKAKSPTNLYTCKYKMTASLDHLDKARFDTNYANCSQNKIQPAMTTNSYLFGILSLILAYIIAIPAGIIMSRKKDKWQDKAGMVYINIMIAVPSLAFIYFVNQLGTYVGLPDKFPIYGYGDIRSYIMPILILGLLSTAGTMIWIRRYMIDQSNSDYVKFARAKGLNEKEIFNRHILKNAIIPFVNGLPSSVVLCISGAVITESVFAIPGMGKMLPDSIKSYNNNMVIALTFIFTTLSIFSLLLGDILMTLVDPRIQLSAKGDSR